MSTSTVDVGGPRVAQIQVEVIDGTTYVAFGWVGDDEPRFAVATVEGIEAFTAAIHRACCDARTLAAEEGAS